MLRVLCFYLVAFVSCSQPEVVTSDTVADAELTNRDRPCFIKGKFIVKGTPDWERFCQSAEPNKACCLKTANSHECCLYLAEVPSESVRPVALIGGEEVMVDSISTAIILGDTVVYVW